MSDATEGDRARPEAERLPAEVAGPGDDAGGWTHDNCLGRAGELRGHDEADAAGKATDAKESMIPDVRDGEDPERRLERKFEAAMEAPTSEEAR